MSATRTEPPKTTTKTTESVANEVLVLRLSKPSTSNEERPKVSWATDTVDNEHLEKKKSKCCCVYKKPKNWQDSSSDSESDCETGHCRGHVEARNQKPGSCGTKPVMLRLILLVFVCLAVANAFFLRNSPSMPVVHYADIVNDRNCFFSPVQCRFLRSYENNQWTDIKWDQ